MIKLPIRQLVELIMRSGDIDSRYVSKDRMQEGAKAHRLLQKSFRELHPDYQSEVSVAMVYRFNENDYLLEGRADGVFCHEGVITIDEIKTTNLPLMEITPDSNPAHWAQAKCYAYILGKEQDLKEIGVRLTYYQLETTELQQFYQVFTIEELARFLQELIEKYSVWAEFSAEWAKVRDQSIKALDFPFPAYRRGQRQLAVQAYRTIVSGGKLFAQAPTGTGKTISVLFPAIKAMGEGKTSKIFYLTAKTITRQVAEEALARMRQGGLKIKTLTLTAKEKICFCDKAICQPDYCQYAKGHFDRVNDAIFAAVQECDGLSRDTIEDYARKFRVCPFELSLDIALLADCVICDYNYVFDPRAYLRRFFAEGGSDYVFLVDEAHNLVDRSREMFSCELRKSVFQALKKQYKGKNRAFTRVINKISKQISELCKMGEQDWPDEQGSQSEKGGRGVQVFAELPQELVQQVMKFTVVCEEMLKEDKALSEDSEFLQLYFEALHFLTIAEFYDERYVTFVQAEGREMTVMLFCLDPSFLLREAFKRGGSAILFSATFSPLDYFRDILGGEEDDPLLALDSPFDSSRLAVLIADHVSTKYHDRERSIPEISRLIASFVSARTGNYLVYFPSYKYLEAVFDHFVSAYPEIRAVKQQSQLSESEREQFLADFREEPETTYVAFCVLGGVFGEGIDLQGDRLIGCVIVSVGLPQLNARQDLIRDYFDRKNGRGFEYAYIFPGINKVLQAAGRVIRTESDRGAVLLIDERFRRPSYSRLLPGHWHPCRYIKDAQSLEKILAKFWRN